MAGKGATKQMQVAPHWILIFPLTTLQISKIMAKNKYTVSFYGTGET